MGGPQTGLLVRGAVAWGRWGEVLSVSTVGVPKPWDIEWVLS